MPKRDDVIFGAPCWMDLATSDLTRASAFYGELFGWTGVDTGEDFGHYTIMSKGEDMIAGIGPKMQDMEGMPDAWTVYLGVEDAAATIEAAKNAGGQSMFDAMQIGDMGTMGVIADPSGAAVGVWQPNVHRGFGLYGEHGSPAWHELMTLDFPAASAFYENVFGVTLNNEDTGEGGPTYKTMNIDGEAYAGIMDANGLMPEGVPSNWMVYYAVDNTDTAIEKAQALGGSVLAPAADTPYGRFALLADPMGASFAILEIPQG